MNRAETLTHTLRLRAADVEIDSSALSAILRAPNPNDPTSDSEQRKDQNSQTQSTQSTLSTPSTPSSSPTKTAKGGSLLGKALGLIAATSLVAAIVLGAGYAYLETSPRCPLLDGALQEVNDEITMRVGENPNITVSCDGDLSSLAEIRSTLSPENRAAFDDNEADIGSAHACLSEAIMPLEITSILELLSTDCSF